MNYDKLRLEKLHQELKDFQLKHETETNKQYFPVLILNNKDSFKALVDNEIVEFIDGLPHQA